MVSVNAIKAMKILIVYRHFWPDSPPYASMLRSIAKQLCADGHSVTILCEQPCYKTTDGESESPFNDLVDGIKVIRLSRVMFWKKISLVRSLSKTLFPIRAFIYCLTHKKINSSFDLVWTATIPPVLSGLIGRKLAQKYNAKFLYHCQDLYPEIAVHMKMIKSHGILHRVMQRIEKVNREEAHVVVSLSEDMFQTISRLAYAPQGKQVVLNNFLLEDFSQLDAPLHHVKEMKVFSNIEAIKVVFAGNLGRFQGLQSIVQAIISLGVDGERFELVFIGEGNALNSLKQLAGKQKNISFLPHMSYSEVKHLIVKADYGLVSLEKGIYKYAFPSKTLSYLGLFVPLVVIVEAESKIALSVEENNIGYSCDGSNVEDIADMFKGMISNTDQISKHKHNAENYYKVNCERQKILNSWSMLVQELDTQQVADVVMVKT